MVHGGRRGSAAPSSHLGSIRKHLGQPFPDLPMCLSCVWYLTDVDASSGGTWVVPGSFRDTRNPFGPEDGIVRRPQFRRAASAEAGSVFSRTRARALFADVESIRCRSCGDSRPVCSLVDHDQLSGMGSMTEAEYGALPESLQPLVRHCVDGMVDEIQLEKQQSIAVRRTRPWSWSEEMMRTKSCLRKGRS